MNKFQKSVLKNLKNTYCRLAPSKIQGIGIFAIKNIPAKTNPFKGINEPRWATFNVSELNSLGNEEKKMISDFLGCSKDGKTIEIPEYGLNGMDISFFLNHSEQPNIKTKDGNTFTTTRLIKIGEELTSDYSTYFVHLKIDK